MLDKLEQIDKNLLLWLNGHHSPFFDPIMMFISGKAEWIPLYALILGFIIWKYRWKAIWITLAVIVLITLSDQTANLFKEGVKRFRPCKDPEIGHLVHIVNNYCRSSYGFVSGHAANSFAFAMFTGFLFKKRWIWYSMLLWAFLVSYSRIYLGVHYPGDILGGAILGICVSAGVYAITAKYLLKNRKQAINI